jgi:OFA family oxalate/formate antiporter-like MFS transporter
VKNERIYYPICGVALLLFLGLIYAWSVFIAPLEAEFGWTRSQTSLTFTICRTPFGLGGFVGGNLPSRTSPGFTMTRSAALLLAGFLLSSRTEELWQIYLFYGVFCGFGVGLSYNAIIGTIVKWFPDKRGMISGVLMMGFGFGSLWLGPVCTALMRNMGWRSVFMALGFVFSALVLIGSRILKTPPAGAALPEAPKKPGAPADQKQYTPLEMLKMASFWQMFLWATLIGGGGMAVIGHAAAMARSLGASAGLAAFAGGCYSVGSGIGRVFYGSVFDRVGRRRTTLISGTIYITATIVLSFSQMALSIPMLYVGIALIGFSGGATPPVTSAFCAGRFGTKHFGVNLSLSSMNLIPSSFIGPLVSGVMTTITGNYMGTFIMAFAFGCTGFVITRIIKD